jgi:hypothetical protein
MADEFLPVNNLLATAKSREVQRAMLAEMRGDRNNAALHFMAAGHMELVLAVDYGDAGQDSLALRSRLSAASCFWRAGHMPEAHALLDSLIQANPKHAAEIQAVIAELTHDYPGLAS